MYVYVDKITENDVNVIMNLDEIIFGKEMSTYPQNYISEICNQKMGFIVIAEDIPVGYVIYDRCLNEISNQWPITIMSIGVLPEYQGNGLGRSLLKSVLELYPNENIYLKVNVKNYVAQNLYTSVGFVTIGEIPNY